MGKDYGQDRLKERSHLDRALFSNPEKDRFSCRTFGWLELDNGVMFFTDRAMFEGFAKLFEVDAHAS